ncbi:MAG: ATP-dependent helicase [Actinomycetia bacterium]|nr:ATP-dependent helicase [Actinomycetes bacterium]
MNAPPFVLDEHQRAVVDHVARAGHGPTLVLAGPGTGKTTTLVEAIAARVTAGTDPERILTLTFSRRAAGELRTRIARRLQRTVAAPLAWTFHGFGFSLVGELLVPDDLGRGVRLLSGPEQEVVVRELLAHDREVGAVAWPEALEAALRTRGFTEQVRSFLASARSVGLEADDIARFGDGRADWAALAQFMVEYLDVLDSRGLLDYSELVARAVAYAESADGRAELRSRYDLVVVDEYQDTDPAQERLLQAIAGDGRDLVVVGDPAQSIYAVRGADVRGITQFPDRFSTPRSGPGRIMSLRTSRRCSTQILAASRPVAALLGTAGGLPVSALRTHRALEPPAGQPAGEVDVWLFPTAEREAAGIAELLRREHLQRGTAWPEMAVLVRSGLTDIPVLARVLAAAGVPVEVASDELPLRDHPALAPLFVLLRYAARPETLTADAASDLLLSPLVGASPSEIRRLGRALRDAHRQAVDVDPPPSAELVLAGVLNADLLAALPASLTGRASTLAQMLASVRRGAQAGKSAHELLWSVWAGSVWADRLAAAADGGGPESVAANRTLDALVIFFDLAARSHERAPRGDLATFVAEVDAQEIPAAPIDDAGVRGQGVRVMTAHRSKGLEWDVVVVAGVQADVWPDLRRRGSLLEPDLLGPDGVREPMTIAEARRQERRLFYVAVTRARRRLVCTAVEAPADEGQRPSPFLDDLGVAARHDRAGVQHPLTLAGVIADLRSTASDTHARPPLRTAAAARLAQLAAAGAESPFAPKAHPREWWGRRALSDIGRRDEPSAIDHGMHLSGSQVEALVRCPLQWYLSRRVHAEGTRGTAAGFGGVIHALAEGVVREQLPAELDALTGALDDVWGQLQYPAAWESAQEHEQAVAAIDRFLRWHHDARDRTVVSTEQQFSATFTVAGIELKLSGRLDRLERDHEGTLVVVDLKTTANARSRSEVATDLQLATYRRLVAGSDAISDPVGAAELVQLRIPAGTRDPGPKVQRQEATEESDETLDAALVHAVTTISSGAYPATPGPACSYCPFTITCPAQAAGREVVT